MPREDWRLMQCGTCCAEQCNTESACASLHNSACHHRSKMFDEPPTRSREGPMAHRPMSKQSYECWTKRHSALVTLRPSCAHATPTAIYKQQLSAVSYREAIRMIVSVYLSRSVLLQSELQSHSHVRVVAQPDSRVRRRKECRTRVTSRRAAEGPVPKSVE